VTQDPRFDAALIDADMPDATGFDLAARLREAGLRAPMIALAPYATREIIRAAEAAGMEGAVGKFQRGQMLDLIRACLEQPQDQSFNASFATGAAA